MSTQSTIFARRTRLAMISSSIIVVVVAACAGLVPRNTGTPARAGDPDPRTGFLGISSGDTPLGFGQEMDLASAVKTVPFAVHSPSSTLASDSSITHVWVQDLPTDDGTRDVEMAIQYRSGIVVTIQPASPKTESNYGSVASQLDLPGVSVGTLSGRLSLVIPSGVDGAGNPGSVAFVVDGVEVVVYGSGFSTEDLKSVASSVK